MQVADRPPGGEVIVQRGGEADGRRRRSQLHRRHSTGDRHEGSRVDLNDHDENDESLTRLRESQKLRETCSKQPEVDQRHKHPPQMLAAREHSLTAGDYKNAGNRLCSLHRYDEALQCYARAISKNPGVPIFYSNKALCHLKLQQWPAALQDCRKALELDPNLIKAHFFLGQALGEMDQHDEALKHLQRAHELAKEKQLNFGDDIAYQIRLTKRRRWSKIESDNAQLEDELYSYLVSLIARDTETKLRGLKERLAAIRGEGPSSQPVGEQALQQEGGDSASVGTVEEQEARIGEQQAELRTKCDIYTDKLETMFNNLKMQRDKREVPDYLCGKISFEIMHDPVLTPSGITYDRRDIEEHLRRVGHFDPITRQPLTAQQLVPNLAMKEVVDAYLNENEWANYY